ncbi:hypothetical protein PV416_00500 [Streptomyces ipomoeae]|jgi:hypothetical protein|uniref:DUF7134 domain-containing protein n=1 Tax=Streptomyces ipomoeae TaxID=103232 RepID=UPI0029BA9CFB|nr:hypothetical protein [Streptomyces ipomoeae]MDX2692812.1 hypothetical protein [Streptomyces ipomoeae]MDX2819601.1 hypothetical protein [Streptomyces ipomoeae]MDX2838360.1 hypothetical protein [Streptomyces ipomoeae]MDX2872680.1 hypothetical protein [Streptomyces ipomoeae]
MDAFLATVVFGISLLAPVLDDNSDTPSLTLQGAFHAAVICASLALRRRWPSAVLAVTAGGTATGFAVTGHKSPLMLATMIAMCTCALHRPAEPRCRRSPPPRFCWPGRAWRSTTADGRARRSSPSAR